MRLKRRLLRYRPTRPTRLIFFFLFYQPTILAPDVSFALPIFFPNYCFSAIVSPVVSNIFQKLKSVFFYRMLHIFSIMINFSKYFHFFPVVHRFQLYFLPVVCQVFFLCSSVVTSKSYFFNYLLLITVLWSAFILIQ